MVREGAALPAVPSDRPRITKADLTGGGSSVFVIAAGWLPDRRLQVDMLRALGVRRYVDPDGREAERPPARFGQAATLSERRLRRTDGMTRSGRMRRGVGIDLTK